MLEMKYGCLYYRVTMIPFSALVTHLMPSQVPVILDVGTSPPGEAAQEVLSGPGEVHILDNNIQYTASNDRLKWLYRH